MQDNRPTWSYDQMQQVADMTNKSIQTRVDQINTMIANVTEVLSQDTGDIVKRMDMIEQVIHACGGEKKAMFTEVTTSFIRVHTRVPLDSPIYPVDNSPAFCRKVIELLIKADWVAGIRCYPASEDRGSIFVVSMKVQ